ncbi:excinuclease ABC subunit UvrC [Desulforhopalus sp. IMCC35007]|uniref:excinuclease ABC subunit UvrC n=1 Tax=Desulforhopalus sp. IMCC35007 TaxID=2569543 RepID=UPI0010ADE48B|nr:excinuclease ABC subunit UvrC [Desulforhopalus sp. IMCC35007]TKB07134.1 excinuclease ABC subunit UvrC [Desulforhopalus sp. IMCC35007]
MFPQSILSSAPHSPGVYIMQDTKSTVLYVGKAKDLHKRLSSYARFSAAEHNKTSILLQKISKVDILLTNTEKEALILEASLIKKHKPKYNIILRDDKNYPYIRVTTQEEWPRVHMARRKTRDKARYFGPYSSSSAMWSTLRLISSLFPLRNCKGSQLKKRDRPCLNRQIGKCLAPCAGNADRQLYMEHVKKIIMLLEGRNRDLIQSLQSQMQEAADILDFEKAASLRDQVSALSRTLEKQVISASHTKDQDVFGFARKDAAVAVALLFIRDGLINGSRSFFLADTYGDDASILSQVLTQFYTDEVVVPSEILLPFEPADLELQSDFLSDKSTTKVELHIPKRGEKMQLVAMANANAQQSFEEKEKKKSSWEHLSKSMCRTLHLDRAPDRIECLDISNISGQQAVGSLVCFTKGEKDSANFRHYKIKTVDGPNDYAMMKEVLERRLSRGLEEDTLPDMFVVDGGKGQLGMAMAVAKELGITEDIDWIGIAKEKESEGEKLYKPERKNPIILPAHNPIILYLMRIRDESHRYGVTFHRKLRNKATLTSELDGIPGIGAEKKKQLLKHMGSLKRVKTATVDDLCEVQGIGPEIAQKIFNFFNNTTT